MPLSRLWISIGVWLVMTAIATAAPIKVLIVDGQNAHNWKETTPILKQLLEETDLFSVDVATTPQKGKDFSQFRPTFAAYDLVVLNYQGDDWPEATQKAFVDYVNNGGGVVCYHFAAAAFPKWREYNQIIGVGGWGNRDETAGPYLCWREGKIVRATEPPGKAGFHGPQQTFQVVVRDPDHPITRGLPKAFMHTADELYCRLRGPAENVTVLATAFAPKQKGGSDEHEPMLMTITYGKGRVFHTALGHAGEHLKSVAFSATFQRGAEWAATGKVTQPVPADFPSPDKASVRQITAKPSCSADQWVVYEGGDGPGKGKHLVLVSGGEEYRSEQMLPQLGKILAARHGFKCTVLFAVDPAIGTIDPTCCSNIPGLEALGSADLMIVFTRFRNLPDRQMRHIVEYVASGKPIVGIRTATHAFNIPAGKTYAMYSFNSKDWKGGFGRQILGETWIRHHGAHGKESTRGVVAPGAENNPIVRGCEDIWGPTDVYAVRLPLPGDSKQLVLGQVLSGMKPTDKPLEGPKNDPMMPVAWTKTYQGAQGQTGCVFTTTMGSGPDFLSEGFRRLLVNAVYWCVGLEDKIPPRAKVGFVGRYEPSPFGYFEKKDATVKPSDHAM